ncbi:unnamed protein product [Darwinula stevensoni]|uniref:HTH CENPB-type domain-containing protein n=1 Tax=Darwinula stevensoni TaxID=69355 RepID=A0A7R9A2C9_9CRUS|nr:unnamed protein product [Darwinula stevensoni]CAG0879255.1 unnamed protein product [Darwinula stevensoni]
MKPTQDNSGVDPKRLTLEEKVHLIRTVKEGRLKKKDITENFGIPPSTLSTITRSKDKVLSAHEKRLFTASCKKLKTAKHEDVEAALLRWFPEPITEASIISGIKDCSQESEPGDESDGEQEATYNALPPSLSDANDALAMVRKFLLSRGEMPVDFGSLLRWFREVRDSTTPVSRTLMREKADQLEKELGVDFSVSWLEQFKHRHGIVF